MIAFHSITFKNFLSYGSNPTTIKLDQSPTTLIMGDNGSGKSTGPTDAITFALFGKPYRRINIPNLVNMTNRKKLLVECEFSIGKKQYKVVRGLNPGIFQIYINGKPIKEDSKKRDQQKFLENNILKMNYKTFTQVVILGSATYIPFMQLSAAARREVVEDLLDIQVFSVMNSIAKENYNQVSQKIVELNHQIELLNKEIDLKEKHLDALSSRSQKARVEIKDEINQLAKDIKQAETEKVRLEGIINSTGEYVNKKEEVSKKQQNLLSLEAKIEQNKKKVEKELAFFKSHEHCPTCDQNIDPDFIAQKIDTLQSDIVKYQDGIDKMQIEIGKIESQLDVIKSRVEKYNISKSELKSLQSNIDSWTSRGTKLYKKLKETDQTSIDDEKDDLNSLIKTKASKVKTKSDMIDKLDTYQQIIIMLKDTGIKSQIVKQYLPVMNALINKYLKAMDMTAVFTLDENFEEKIKARGYDEMPYMNFSEGEKMRFNLAILFAWRELAKMRASAHTNLLVLDEVVDSSLDSAGTDDLIKLINTLKGCNTFVISQKGDALYDKFRSAIKVEKVNGFSKLC